MGLLGLPEPKRHLALALKYLEEGKTLIEKDPLQASEKLYKAAEEAVKALAIGLDLEQARIAAKEGTWWTRLLNRAAEAVTEKLGIEGFALWWKVAYYLHVEGFHEARLYSEDIKRNYRYIEALVTTAEKILKGKA